MKERPILFSAPMVRALLAGTKTQTRRILKQATGPSLSVGMDDDLPGTAALSWLWGDGPGYDVHETIKRVTCPYGRPGDRLWVRETWGVGSRPDPWGGYDGLEYRADEAFIDEIEMLPCYKVEPPDGVCYSDYRSGWKPSIHMPRWASRITLEVTGVRVERLQDISQADAMAEGAPPSHQSIDRVSRELGYADFSRSWYAQLWDRINGPGSWDANPWVWVVAFKRVTP